jgi:uncharacterized protein
MEKLFQKSYQKVNSIQTDFIRDFIHHVDWDNRMIGIEGARGVGKTTLLLQYMKTKLPSEEVLYVSLDDIYFVENKLIEVAESFEQQGGRVLVLDEVHKYASWSREIKNIYDDLPNLRIVFTGSSIIHLYKSKADLSRRAVMYHMPNLSFREFMKLDQNIEVPTLTMDEILTDHMKISTGLLSLFRPLPLFKEYLSFGCYPFFLENKEAYHQKLTQIINLILEVDLPYIQDIQFSSIEKLKKLLYILATSAPFKPNVQKLSEKIGVTRNTIINFLQYLQEAKIVNLLYSSTKGVSMLQKPEKVYLQNPNLLYALSPNEANIGSLRETFFYNQLAQISSIQYPGKGDFLVNDQWVFEVGGKDKSSKQIEGKGYVAADDIEIGFRHKIPLWLFGFLY